MDCGDYVVVSNARNIKVTGKKAEQLVYRHHTMFPGGLKEIKYRDMMAKKPDEVRLLHALVSPVFISFVDHPASSLWHVTQKQTARQKDGTLADISRRTFRYFERKCYA